MGSVLACCSGEWGKGLKYWVDMEGLMQIAILHSTSGARSSLSRIDGIS